MKKVLFWGDNPHGITGFGKVVKNIIRQVYDPGKFTIDVLGISYIGDPYQPDHYMGRDILYDVYPPFEMGKQMDLYGANKLMTMLSSNKVDILFILQDTFIIRNIMQQIVELREKLSNKFQIIYYFPIDCNFVYPDWITRAVSLADYPVCYTEFGKKVAIKHDKKLKGMDVIYHGTDKSLYRPWENEMRNQIRASFWKETADKFLVLNVNRNQPRKDLNRTFAVFSELKRRVPDSFLFVLASPADIGGNIIDVAKQFGLEWGTDWLSPDPNKYNMMLGIPEDQIVTIYNTVDVCISTTLGEGWGLSLTEAMACGCPVVFPDNTSITEIIGKDKDDNGLRGTLISSGVMGNRICLGAQDNNLSRPLVDVGMMVDSLVKIANLRDKDINVFKTKAINATKWVPDWTDVGSEWVRIFEEASVAHDESKGKANES